MNIYKPNPMDTTGIRLPDEILGLLELLAKNTHEVWAQNRIAEGWTYGTVRDDTAKTTPCLIPYEELPDSEKEYDRCTSQQALKFLYAMGYRLIKE